MTVRRSGSVSPLLAVLVAAGVLLRLTVFAPAPVPVRVVAAEKGRVEETVTNSRAGTVKARRRAKLAPETGGRVLLLPRRRGTRVRKGELLLRVDDALQRAQLRLSGDERKAALAQRDQACLAAERAGAGPRAHAEALEGRPRLVRDPRPGRERGPRRRRRLPRRPRRRRAGGLGGGPRPGPARPDRPPGALRRHRGRHLHRGGRVDLALAAGPAHPAGPRPHRHPLDLRQRADGRGGLRPHPRRASRRGSPWTRAPAGSFAARVVEVAPYVVDRLEQNRTVEIELELDDAARSRLAPSRHLGRRRGHPERARRRPARAHRVADRGREGPGPRATGAWSRRRSSSACGTGTSPR